MVIDVHAHIIPKISGRRGLNLTSSTTYGKGMMGDTEVQMLPPFLTDSSFDVKMLVACMDFSGIDKAVLLQNPVYGIINAEISEAIKSYPDRFIGTIQVDPFDKNALEDIRKYYSPKQSVLKFEISEGWGWTTIYPELKLDSELFLDFWKLASELGMNVIIDPGKVNETGYQVEEIDRISDLFPTVNFLIEHLGYMTSDLLNDKVAYDRWLKMIQLAKKSNVSIGFSAIYALLEEDYPCEKSMELLQIVVQEVGSGKVLWGSDVPTTLNRYTYIQMKELITKKASYLNSHEIEEIMGLNALNFLNFF